MAVDTTALEAAKSQWLAAVSRAKTVGGSAVALITGFSGILLTKVTEALQADNAADQGTIDAVTAIFTSATAEVTASNDALEAAVLAGTPSAPPPVDTPAAG